MKLLNFADYIEELYGELALLLAKVGWELRDGYGYFEYKPNSKKNMKGTMNLPESWMVLYPEVLEYDEGSTSVSTIWFRTGDREVSEEAMEAFTKALTPFIDEDYTGRNLWVNPLYPDGYWQNHALSDD